MLAHWEDVTEVRFDVGPMGSGWRRLAKAAGAVGVGCNRVRVDGGAQSTPVHSHSGEEEIVYVLAGDGFLWLDGAAIPVREGDCAVLRAGRGAHTLVGGDGGLDVLVYGPRFEGEAGHLPRAGVAWIGGGAWVEANPGDPPFAREAAAGRVELGDPAPRPANVVALADVPAEPWGEGDVAIVGRDLGVAAGSVSTGLVHMEVAPGALSSPPHCHSAEEEVFVVLGGEGHVLLGDAEHAVRAGSVVARPPGTGVAHAFRAGPDGLTLLAYGTREPNDITFYPRSQKVCLRGVGAMFRVETVDYWDGER